MQHEESTGSTVGEKLGDATEVISARTSDVVDQGRGMVQRQIGARSAQLGSQADAASQRMRQVADQARADGNDQHARVAEQAAEQTERAGAYLNNVDPEQLLTDVEGFARREPWLVAGVSLAVGFIFARSLKASSGRRSSAGYTERRLADDRWATSSYVQPEPIGVGAGASREY